MKQFLFIALIAIGLPLSFANYENTPYNAEQTGDNLPNPAENAHLIKLQEDLQAINANEAYNNYKKSEFISDKLIESTLASKVRNGEMNVVPPNVIDQAYYRSLLVPQGQNTQVIANNPLSPVVVYQAPTAPINVNSGPPEVVRQSPVIYKIKPSVIYQQEVINKIPTPINVNPIYVKVFKAGKTVDVPTKPVVQQYEVPSYNYAPAYPSPSYDSSSYQSPEPAQVPYQQADSPSY